MNRYGVAVVAILSLSTHPALAASPAVEAAAKAISQIGADATRLQGYCKIVKEINAAGDDEAKIDALEQQMEDLLKSFGPQFEQVLALSESTDSETPDGQALEAAFDKLDAKCGK
jgi:hypothetical protein